MENLALKYLESSAIKYKDKIAFISGENKITFSMTRNKSLAVSNEIINRIGFTKNRPILIYLPKSIEAIVAMLGAVYSGNFYTPTSTNFPSKKIESLVNILNPSIIITNSSYQDNLINIGISEDKIICYDLINFNQDTTLLKNNVKQLIDTDLIYTYFTSGSTGIPKGVTISHRNVVNFIEAACRIMPIDQNTIFGNQSALHFDITTQDLYTTLKQGSTMIIIPEHLFAFPKKLIEYIDEQKINFIFWVPSAYINVCLFKALEGKELKELKSIMFAGEVMPVKYYNQWKKHLPNLSFVANAYGPTETTVDCTYYIVDREFDDNEEFPLGYAIENTGILLFDKDNKLITEPNIQGELCVIGTSLSPGYWNNRVKTDEVFVQNPLHDNYDEKMYRTGDLAIYNNQGLLLFCGRKDDQIKHLGYRIELGEIENAALSLEYINSCVSFYNDKKRKITLIYTSNTDQIENKTIKLDLTNILPKYMVPTEYYRLDSLPININGKIDRVLLKSQFI